MADLSEVAALKEEAPTEGEFVTYPDSPFQLFRPYAPAGDQPAAILAHYFPGATVGAR